MCIRHGTNTLFTEKRARGLNVDQISRIRTYFLYLELYFHACSFIGLYKVQVDYRSHLKTLISKAYGVFNVKLTETLKIPLKSRS
jgi:hypothetical protein